MVNPKGLIGSVRESNFSYFVCTYVSEHKQIYLPFVHFCMHAILRVDKLKTGGSLVKIFFIKTKQKQSPTTIILNTYKFK